MTIPTDITLISEPWLTWLYCRSRFTSPPRGFVTEQGTRQRHAFSTAPMVNSATVGLDAIELTEVEADREHVDFSLVDAIKEDSIYLRLPQ